jgi:hypothetical protein
MRGVRARGVPLPAPLFCLAQDGAINGLKDYGRFGRGGGLGAVGALGDEVADALALLFHAVEQAAGPGELSG